MQPSDFLPVRVLTEEQSDLLRKFETAYASLALIVIEAMPNSAHRTAALRKLLESKMTLIHGITHEFRP